MYRLRHSQIRLPYIFFGAVMIAVIPQVSSASCDMTAINARSVDDSAKLIFDEAEYIGVGTVEQESGYPHRQQQRVRFSSVIKGDQNNLLISPFRLNKVARHDGYIRWFTQPTDAPRVFALTKTGDGYASSSCLVALIAAKPSEELRRSLVKYATGLSAGKP